MDKGRFLIETHLRAGQSLGELAKAYGVHRSWLYKRLARYRREGAAGLETALHEAEDLADRGSPTGGRRRSSGCANSSPSSVLDAGAATIQAHLADHHEPSPRCRPSGGC